MNYKVGSTISNNGSVNSKQFQQVKLRADLSVKSNKSPNRYNIIQPHAKVQQTINYMGVQSSLVHPDGHNVKQISQSLVAQNRNRNLIGN